MRSRGAVGALRAAHTARMRQVDGLGGASLVHPSEEGEVCLIEVTCDFKSVS